MATDHHHQGSDEPIDDDLIDVHRESFDQYERRQARDRKIGLAGLILFGVLLLVYLLMEFVPNLAVLPGGHSEAYFAVAVAGVVWAAWVEFDLGMNRRHRR